MPLELKGSTDVFVLDVSKNWDKKTPHERLSLDHIYSSRDCASK
ncbi:hypothetical protein Xind_03455 [Xenorhabdus indica]|nr:hypothetical protein [Xenorhabdus indica]